MLLSYISFSTIFKQMREKLSKKKKTLNVLAPVQRPGFVYNRCLTENQAACCAPHVCEQVFHKSFVL